MLKIFIDPGHGGSDPGANANGLKEKDLTLTIAKKIRDILASEYEDVAVKMSRTGDETVSLNQRTAAANAWGANYFLSVHINAGGGEGFETYIHTITSTRTQTIRKKLHPEIMEQIGGKDRGMKTADFSVLRKSNMSACLTENLFIDNDNDAKKLKDSGFLEKIARGHVNGLQAGLGLKRKQQPAAAAPKTGGTLYKVQVGAFEEKENADQLASDLQKKGYRVIIIKE